MKGLSWLVSGILISVISGAPQPNINPKDVSSDFLTQVYNFVRTTQSDNKEQYKQQPPTSNLKATSNSVSDVLQNFLKAEFNYANGANSNPTTTNQDQNDILKAISHYIENGKGDKKEEGSDKKQQTQNLRTEQENDKSQATTDTNEVEKVLLDLLKSGSNSKDSANKHEDKQHTPTQNLRADQIKYNAVAAADLDEVGKALSGLFKVRGINKDSANKREDKQQAHAQNLKAYDTSKSFTENVNADLKEFNNWGHSIVDKISDIFHKDGAHRQNLRAEDNKIKNAIDSIGEEAIKGAEGFASLFSKLFSSAGKKSTYHQNLRTESNQDLNQAHFDNSFDKKFSPENSHLAHSRKNSNSRSRSNRQRHNKYNLRAKEGTSDDYHTSHSKNSKNHKGVLWHKLRAAKN